MANTEIVRETEGTHPIEDTYDEWHRDSMKIKPAVIQCYRVTRDICYNCGAPNIEVAKKIGLHTYCTKCAQ